MNKVGFKNFRRFLDFQPLEYKGITFLVGRNNAGKSTLVKALLLINDFLKSDNIKSFQFGRNVLEDANIVTYDRARNYSAKEDFISFSFQIDNFLVEIRISGLPNATSADVHLFSIKDIEQGFEFKFEPQNTLLTVSALPKSNVDSELDSTITILQEQLKAAKADLKKADEASDPMYFISKRTIVSDLEKKLKSIKETKKSQQANNSVFSVSSHFDVNLSALQIFDDFVIETQSIYNTKINDVLSGKKQTKEFESLRAFKEASFSIEKSFKSFLQSAQSISFIYLGANPAKQSALFPIRERNNALAQSIHDFYQLRLNKGEAAYDFIEKWMKVFDVGEAFNIKIYAGESYEVKINSKNNLVHLADKGMGSIQAMLLIFRLASIIHNAKKHSLKPTVIIEEPELNLHPRLQSLLADLFLDVKEKHQINFIVETHSEYLIRKTQLFVKEKEFEIGANENPFCVIYFDDEKGPYKMNYREDGKFIEEFGKGFYDESALLTLNLL